MQVGVFDGLLIPPVSEPEKLLSNVGLLVKKARRAAVPIIFVQHNGAKGHPLEVGTGGWHIHPEIGFANEDVIIQKHTPDSFYRTDLHDKLISNDVKRLAIAGIQTEYCIDTTCRRAFALGFEVTLVQDAHSTWDTERLEASQIISHHNSLLNEWFVSLKGAGEIDFNQ